MAITKDPQQERRQEWMALLGQHRRPTAYVLFAIAVALALFAAWMFWLARDELHRWEYIWVGIWFSLLTLLTAAGGLWQLLYEPSENLDELDISRLLVLTVGGLSGLATVILSLALTYQWWHVFSGGLEAWRKDWWRVGLSLLMLFLGLIVMFASLQLARPQERSTAWMRRLLYGYNTVLTALLLLAILLGVNVLTYARLWPFKYFETPADWTASNIHTLSSASKNLLESLTEPVKIYALMSSKDPLRPEVETLVDNARAVTDKIQVQYVSPDLDPDKLDELQKKYHFAESVGLLVVYGSGAQEQDEFIQGNDLFGTDQAGRNAFLFKGEDVLMKTISFLEQHKTKAVVYFTQGHGEYDLNQVSDEERGLGSLKERLQKDNYEVKELKLDATVKEVPADADVVVIVAPTHAHFPTEALEAYMDPSAKARKKKGKLVVLFDVVKSSDGTMVRTGLEDFLQKFNVQVGDNRIINANPRPSPLLIDVAVNPRLVQRNPIAHAFALGTIPMFDCRTVGPGSGSNPAAGPYLADSLLIAADDADWAETDLNANPLALVVRLRQDLRLQQKLRHGMLSVAAVVTAPHGGAQPMNPHAMMGEQEPRLVAYGSARWLSNRLIRERESIRGTYYALFTSTLSWLRERPDIGQQANAKERQIFTLGVRQGVYTQLEWLPLVLLVIGIMGTGGGIWLVRRR